MELSTIGSALGYVAVSLVTGVGAWMTARRKMSRDGVELTRDRSEISIIELLTKQRDEAVQGNHDLTERLKQVSVEKQERAEEVIQLKQDITKLNQQLRLLNSLVKRLSSTLDITKSELKKVVDEQNRRKSERAQEVQPKAKEEGAE